MIKLEEKERVVNEIGEFIWDGFCNADSVGVKLDNLLTWPGLHLTTGQIKSLEAHYYDIDGIDNWDENDETVRDIVASATDCKDYEKMFSWLAFIVGDTTAEQLVNEWKN